MVNSKAYYIGVLLSASKNPLNKIQFFVGKKNGKTACYSRTGSFESKPNTDRMNLVGFFSSDRAAVSAINEAKQDMSDRGLSVPGTKIYRLK